MSLRALQIAVLVLAVPAAVFGAEGKAVIGPKTAGRVIESLPLHLALAGMAKASAPYVLEGELVLSISGPYRIVAAAFAHEGFAVLHPYEKNKQGVFVLAYPVPLMRDEPLEYRIVADGAWIADPADPDRRIDPLSGLELSVAKVPYISDIRLGLYRLLDEDGCTARFLFRSLPGESVTVSGDFNNWDPFIHELVETEPGLYRLDLPLTPGRHFYTFIHRGETLTDPLNPDKAVSRDGKTVSVITVPAGS